MSTNEFYLFSYGSNGLQQLAERLVADLDNIKTNSLEHTQIGWQRYFFGKSQTINRPNWEGSSVATIIPVQNGKVMGILLKISKDRENSFKVGNQSVNFNTLSTREAFPTKYYLHFIDNKDSIPIYAFVHNPVWMVGKNTTTVTDKYLKAICRMLRDRRRLKFDDNQIELQKPYKIDIKYINPTVPDIPQSGITKKTFAYNQIDN